MRVTGGTAEWTRFIVEVGPAYQLAWRRLRLEVHAEVLLTTAWARLNSVTSTAFAVGGGAGIRTGVALGRVVPFFCAGVNGWVQPPVHTFTGDALNDPNSFQPARTDALLGVGLSYAIY
jgi:hypothetical protein